MNAKLTKQAFLTAKTCRNSCKKKGWPVTAQMTGQIMASYLRYNNSRRYKKQAIRTALAYKAGEYRLYE